ncbi:MAG: DUF58 domain-containing protein [Phycisphaerae bacterium]|nr:DUF58 domain-containing protein [Phycisphaerae bacterium]
MPKPQEYLRPEIIAQVQRLDLRARFLVEGFLAGLHRSPFHGFSVEFSEHRKYVPGDDPRLLDWNVYAKTDRYYVRKYQAETNLDTYLLVDMSGSMDYPALKEPDFKAGKLRKIDYSICLAAAIGHMLIHQQDAVGLATFGSKLQAFLPPKTKRSHLLAILSELTNVRPYGATRLAQTIHEVADRVRKRSLMVLFSDLLTDEVAPIIEALHHLRFRGHDLIIFHVLSEDEATFPFHGPRRFIDVEGETSVHTDADGIRAAYLEELKRFIDEYRTETAAVHADFVSVHTGMTFDNALLRFLIGRQKRF